MKYEVSENPQMSVEPKWNLPTKEDYKFALLSQNASNLSGVVHSLAEVLPRIWDEAHSLGKGTDYVAHHPIVTLYVTQIASLNDRVISESSEYYHNAYEECTKKSQED